MSQELDKMDRILGVFLGFAFLMLLLTVVGFVVAMVGQHRFAERCNDRGGYVLQDDNVCVDRDGKILEDY